MFYKIGWERQVSALKTKLPKIVYEVLLASTAILDTEYGAQRNYLQSGGYSLIAETEEYIAAIKNTINYETHPCEWAEYLGNDNEYVGAIYLLNDDFSITLYIPTTLWSSAVHFHHWVRSGISPVGFRPYWAHQKPEPTL